MASSKSVVLAALRGRRKTAETILENAGHRNPSMDGVEQSEDISYEGENTAGGENASPADQANLGDF